MFNAPIDPEIAWRIFRVQQWQEGRSFEELDNMKFTDYADILAVREGEYKAKQFTRSREQRAAVRGKKPRRR